MATLIVTAHPDPGSLTHVAARRVAELLPAGTVETAHLAQEGFDPRFTTTDRERYLGRRELDPAVTAEQERLDRATDLVLVFPVWWWSMPALLKGWVDRVFIAGWAFDLDDADHVVPRLGRLTTHLLPLSGTTEGSFARHGYTAALSTQVHHGLLDYCGMPRGVTAYVHESESGDRDVLARDVDAAASAITAAIGQRG